MSSPALGSDKKGIPAVSADGNESEATSSGGNSTCLGDFGLRRAHSVSQSKNISNRPSPAAAEPLTPLHRVLTSTEPLKAQSSNRSQNELMLEVPARTGSREGRQFAVGNVGQNGKMYLRPIPTAHQSHGRRGQSQPPSLTANTMNSLFNPHGEMARNGFWSGSQWSDLRPSIIREDSAEHKTPQLQATPPAPESNGPSQLSRRHSFSSLIEEGQTGHSGRRGELKIVIDRPFTRGAESDRKPIVPPLAIPIPESRLGGFKFTPEGAPMLCSSAYTRASVSDDAEIPPHPSRYSFTQPLFPSPRAWSGHAPSPAQSSVFYKLKEPIDPGIFDALISIMDDASVVRYLKGSKQVSAATPARIVAQISSDSFMDYELVSDFFLTFRSYLSPSNLLSLLLARLQWAINRLEGDGRIIRIRVFAALRHWILNYFVEDFLTNRSLRVQLCDRLNEMYDDVKSRKDDPSDAKILLDLKKCWNGRCSLYWENLESSTTNQLDDIAFPGGDDDPQDSSACIPPTAPMSPLNPSRKIDPVSPNSQPAFVMGAVKRGEAVPLERPAAEITRGGRDSSQPPCSPCTVQAGPCSFATMESRRESLEPAGPQPVPLAAATTSPVSPRVRARPMTPMSPQWRRSMYPHQRSGSFSDSYRDDRAPLPQSNLEGYGVPSLQPLPHSESIIRGNVYGPPEPLTPFLAPPSPGFDFPQTEFGRRSSTKSEGPSKPQGPGVKTFIGSIRRALTQKSPGNPQAAGRSQSVGLQGKTSALPLNVGFRSDGYRARKAGWGARQNFRVDMLCECSFNAYQQLIKDSEQSVPVQEPIAAQHRPRKAASICSSSRYRDHIFSSNVLRESHCSDMTTRSQSIVIVDNTGIPVMSGGIETLPLHNDDRDRSQGRAEPSRVDVLHSTPPNNFPESASSEAGSSGTILDERSCMSGNRSSLAASSGRGWVSTLARGLRKYASHESAMFSNSLSSMASKSNNPDSLSTRGPSSSKPAPPPLLRRRPGGDLRKMQQNNHRRSDITSYRSGFSDTTSVAESGLYIGEARQGGVPRRANEESLLPEHYHSIARSKSSQHIRRSFEAAVATFSKIPDESDGGIESALLKLEGRWKGETKHDHAAENTDRRTIDNRLSRSEPAVCAVPKLGVKSGASVVSGHRASSYVESEDSYSSIPLLERGLADDSMKRPPPSNTAPITSAPQPLPNQPATIETASHPSIEMVEKTESMNYLGHESSLTQSTSGAPLPSESEMDDCASELSSELSVDFIDKAEATESALEDDAHISPTLRFSSLGVPTHPLAPPPSPPITVRQPGSTSTYPNPLDADQRPFTPQLSPRARLATPDSNRASRVQGSAGQTQIHLGERLDSPAAGPSVNSAHVPFILAYESELLAHQFTIVEQAALGEIDWKDLVDMRWSHSSQSTLNWVNYLAEQDRKGIDMVVARFNLMVKWAISEIVMTSDITMRANTITKFIHMALQARKLSNYATMLQITIALCSVDCTRLTKTWELVPETEKQQLKDMEFLIQPTRNFHNLRSEMETCNLQDGCIPFVGLYVQDLTYNAQKPAQIASTRDGEPLVNFERYRTAATIVKSLLRLIDASTRYTFEPTLGLVERCLWISALPDEKIMALSKQLE